MSLKLVSVNIERSKHLDRVFKFLDEQKPDVVCLQEFSEHDLPAFQRIYKSFFFVPQTVETEHDGTVAAHGSAIATNLSGALFRADYYDGNADSVPKSDVADPSTFTKNNGILLRLDVEKDRGPFCIYTTHFTWSPAGLPTDLQRSNMGKMLDLLGEVPEFVVCGDFNAPRGGEIFTMLSSAYKDEIPQEYVWSVDLDLHRAGGGTIQRHAKEAGFEGFMVDGLFTTPGYRAENVKLVGGVSDHMAIVADITHVG